MASSESGNLKLPATSRAPLSSRHYSSSTPRSCTTDSGQDESRINWADINDEEDADSDVISSPWFSSATEGPPGSESQSYVPRARPKLKNKKLPREMYAGKGTPGASDAPDGDEDSRNLSTRRSGSSWGAGASGAPSGPRPTMVGRVGRTPTSAASSDFESGSASSVRSEQLSMMAPMASTISDEELERLMPQIPLDDEGKITSVGSIGHGDGPCRSCVFYTSKLGCQSGIRCQFCHMHHRRKNKLRPCKGKRDRHRKLIERVSDMLGKGGDGEGDEAGEDSAA